MKVFFSHGKESGPWGSKIKRLAAIATENGCTVESIDYTDLPDPDRRSERLLGILQKETENFILVGSSMGGYISLAASAYIPVRSLFLMAPALYMPGYAQQEYPSKADLLEIVHGWSDDVIPPEHSIRYARKADCTLHLISGDHRLNSSIEIVTALFKEFLGKALIL